MSDVKQLPVSKKTSGGGEKIVQDRRHIKKRGRTAGIERERERNLYPSESP
jgi:hypothetical protein